MPYFDEPVGPCRRNLRGMHERSMPSGTELTREIQLTNWSTAGKQGKLVFVVSTEPSLAQLISLFKTGKNSLSITKLHISCSIFTLRFLSRKKRRKEIRFEKQNFFS